MKGAKVPSPQAAAMTCCLFLTLALMTACSRNEERFLKSAEIGDIDTIKSLLDAGSVDVDATDDQEQTALMKAAIKGKMEVVQLLFLHHADPELRDATGKTAAQLAATPAVRNKINSARAAAFDERKEGVKKGDSAGFFTGIWHGALLPVRFIYSLFSDYKVFPAQRAWHYWVGWWIGLMGLLGAGRSSRR